MLKILYFVQNEVELSHAMTILGSEVSKKEM